MEAENLYIISAIAVVLIVVIIARSLAGRQHRLNTNAKVAVKTSRGLIKMNNDALAELLARIQADLMRHQGKTRTTKYELEINNVLEQVRTFIKQNPHDTTMCRGSDKADIIDQAMSDTVTPHQSDYHLAHAAVLSHDDLEYGSDSQQFDYLLKNIDVLIWTLRRDVCDGGMIDVDALELLLRKLDEDLTNGAEFTDDPDFSDEIGYGMKYQYHPYIIPRISLFESRHSQIEGMSAESILRGLPGKDSPLFTVGPQKARNAQQRSQMFRENHIKLGSEHYNDEDMLGSPTYEQLAL
jgi:hypothetical protein